jgi:4'-phosphopantetheinyl transferase
MNRTITVLFTKFGWFDPDNGSHVETKSLPPDQLHACWRYKKIIDRQRCIAGRILLLKCLKKYSIPSTALNDMITNRYGKLYLPTQLNFNISHSGRIAICAATQAMGDIGIDIEKIIGVDFDDFKDALNSESFSKIQSAADPTEQFYKTWTAIESAMKADGRGMQLAASEIVPDFQKNVASIGGKKWYLYQLFIDSNYACHLATDIKEPKINLEQITFGCSESN